MILRMARENAQETDLPQPPILSLPTRIGMQTRDRHTKMVSVIPRIFEEVESGLAQHYCPRRGFLGWAAV